MWPMVPVTHMIYRLWQLGRSSAIVAILNGPQHLLYMQVHSPAVLGTQTVNTLFACMGIFSTHAHFAANVDYRAVRRGLV